MGKTNKSFEVIEQQKETIKQCRGALADFYPTLDGPGGRTACLLARELTKEIYRHLKQVGE